ncbi:peptide-N4-asparagine amidase [Dyella sp. 2RAB6]|uniref:peptide-N4-asparagine amidase n=1 Tax=Dyella sp. 2RAB6 TaxID=3232992 RepID=UPI003F8FE4D9
MSVLLACLACNLSAADAPVPGTDFIVRADPLVPRPSSTPCTEQLAEVAAIGESQGSFNYSPYHCGVGPWAKIVLEMDFVLEEDRVGNSVPLPLNLWLNGVNLYSGSIALTGNHDVIAPCYEAYCGHVERDVTDYASVLRWQGPVQRGGGNWSAGLGNEKTHTGPSFVGIARLKYYPRTVTEPLPSVPDAVLPLGAGNFFSGGYFTGVLADLRSTSDRLATSFNTSGQASLPRNIERAYLDVTVRPSAYNYVPTSPTTGRLDANDPWYSCLPAPLAVVLPRLLLDDKHNFAAQCIGGAFREAEVSIDEQPAGVVPLYPAYPTTSERDAQLWRPALQPQELLYVPHRVDLSPFAARLSDGAPHTIAVRIASNSRPGLTNNPVAGAWASANLLLYQDRRVKQVTGMLTRNDLAGQPPLPSQRSTVALDRQGHLRGSVVTALQRHFVIDGYVNGSKGRIRHRVERWVNFDNTQDFDVSSEKVGTQPRRIFEKTITQHSTETGKTRTYLNGVLANEHITNYGYPASSYYYLWHDPTVEREIRKFRQDVGLQRVRRANGSTLYSAVTQNLTGATLDVTTGLFPYRVFTKVNDRGGWQTFRFNDSVGSCYDAMLTTRDGKLATWATGGNCTDGQNRLSWQSRPDGSPDALGWLPYP